MLNIIAQTKRIILRTILNENHVGLQKRVKEKKKPINWKMFEAPIIFYVLLSKFKQTLNVKFELCLLKKLNWRRFTKS